MSQILINQYLNQLSTLKKVSGSRRESVVREAFKDLLKGSARAHDLHFVPEYEIETKTKDRRYVDGALLYELRMPFGYWEAKDEKDNLDTEIALKLKRGYPQDNIIFEDTREAVLIQDRQEVTRSPVDDVVRLEKLLALFFGYERKEIAEFRVAVAQFKVDLPEVLDALRAMIQKAHTANSEFRKASSRFLNHAQETINPNVTDADVREMLIQHVLTEDIFSKVFGEDDFHRQNNVAKELYALEATFFTGDLKKRTLRGLDAYYAAIRSTAAQIGSHLQKQTFLKVIYENFYKVYNKNAADRLGVVYTPNEIVRFMIESTDWLCENHFGRNLIDKDVDILDPATGTGTFISELLEHFRGQPVKLKYKYLTELHANEVAILPYYVANLNVEATYAAITGDYLEYPNLCFVDTLDNVAGLRKHVGHIDDLFGSVSEQNVARINRQNSRRISVVIGNPPYNANQLNENENNKNREYPEIDRRIKDTYVAASTAQKTKLYDMYARFFRWASDRLDENGIIAFVSNNSFVQKRTFDGFRKCLAREFNEVRVIDLKGEARTSGEQRRREGGNVFENKIRVGVAVWFCIRKKGVKGCKIFYEAVRDYEKFDEKQTFLVATPMREREFVLIRPDAKGNWLNITSNDFDTLIPIASKETKSAKGPSKNNAIFKSYSFGVVTNRDEWVYGQSPSEVSAKVEWLIDRYNEDRVRLAGSVTKLTVGRDVNTSIKWTRAVKNDLVHNVQYVFEPARIIRTVYRPYVKRYLYFSPKLNEMPNLMPLYFGPLGTADNCAIVLSDPTSQKEFMAWVVNACPDMHVVGAAAGAVTIPMFVPGADGQRENVTDWALDKFRRKYQGRRVKKARSINKGAIFCYVYAVLHDPVYREKYGLNLRRDLPRIPLYKDFWAWVEWGRRLMELHIGYEKRIPIKLSRSETIDERAENAGLAPTTILKADKDAGRIVVDSVTSLDGIPAEAWNYKLGVRSALEWVLDQYKETKPKDPTIRERFDTYRFPDHKEEVIDLLFRVTTVSVETMEIIGAMKSADRV